MMNESAMAQITTATVTIQPTIGLFCWRNSTRPTRKRSSASCKRRGKNATSSNVFQRINDSWRTSLTRSHSSGEEQLMLRKSRVHCFVKMPMDAVTILQTRLRNQNVLTRMSTVDASDVKGTTLKPLAYNPSVPFRRRRICARRIADAVAGS